MGPSKNSVDSFGVKEEGSAMAWEPITIVKDTVVKDTVSVY